MGNQVAQVTPSQDDKVTTINQATTQLDNLISQEVLLTDIASFILTDTQQDNNFTFHLNTTAAGAFTMALQARSKFFAVRNETTQTVTVEVDPEDDGANGRTVDVSDGELVILYSDGTNVDLLSAGGGGGGGSTDVLDWKQSVRVATAAAGTLASDFENGDTVDGVVLATNDRILIKDQTTASENGIYIVNATGAPTRATDFDEDAEVTTGAATFVEEGTANGGEIWILTTTGAITVGVTNLTFTELSGGSAAVPVQDEGTQIVAAPTAIDFRGSLVQVTDQSGVARVTISDPATNAISFIIAAGDETTAITTGTGKVSFRAPYAFTIAEVRASLVTASTSGVVTVDVNEGGTSIFGANKLTIDQDETTSVTAATAADLSDTAIADDAVLTIDVDAAGTGAAGLKITIITTAIGSGSSGQQLFPDFTTPAASDFTLFQSPNNVTDATGNTPTITDLTDPPCVELRTTGYRANQPQLLTAARALTGSELTFRYEVGIIANLPLFDHVEFGIMFRESSSNVVNLFGWEAEGGGFRLLTAGAAHTAGGDTGGSSTGVTIHRQNGYRYYGGLVFIAVEYDGTDYWFDISMNGTDYNRIGRILGANDGFTTQPNSIGVFINPDQEQIPFTATEAQDSVLSVRIFHDSLVTT